MFQIMPLFSLLFLLICDYFWLFEQGEIVVEQTMGGALICAYQTARVTLVPAPQAFGRPAVIHVLRVSTVYIKIISFSKRI